MKLKINELDILFIFHLIVGAAMFLGGVFYDPIAVSFKQYHVVGFGIRQIMWCAFWGMYILITVFYQMYYGE